MINREFKKPSLKWYAFIKLWLIFYVSAWPRNTWFLLTARFLSTYVYTSVCSRVAVDTTTLFATVCYCLLLFVTVCYSTFTFFLLPFKNLQSSWTAWPFKMDRYVVPKCRYGITIRHCIKIPEGRRSHLLIVLFHSSLFSNSGNILLNFFICF